MKVALSILLVFLAAAFEERFLIFVVLVALAFVVMGAATFVDHETFEAILGLLALLGIAAGAVAGLLPLVI